jgi:hypothetical protein
LRCTGRDRPGHIEVTVPDRTFAGADRGGAAGGGFLVEVTGPGSRLVLRACPDRPPGPAMAGIPARAGQLAVVPPSSGSGSWLVVTEPVRYCARRMPFTCGYDSFSLDVTGAARPGTDGALVAGLDLSGIGRVIGQIAVRCAAAGGAAVLAVAVLTLAVTRAILRPRAQTDKTAAGRLWREPPDGQPATRPASRNPSTAR